MLVLKKIGGEKMYGGQYVWISGKKPIRAFL